MGDDGDLHHALAGGWMPELTLATQRGELRVADLMHEARGVLLDLNDTASAIGSQGRSAERSLGTFVNGAKGSPLSQWASN
jgi:hypothetical protein